MPHFADRVIQRHRSLGHPLCVGLDPHLHRIPSLFRRGDMHPGDPRTAESVEAFLLAVLERVGDRVAVVKPQIAFFEALGWRGIRVLERVVETARKQGLLVLLDAKRGDIGSTAAAYGGAYLDQDSPMPVDAMTLNPYLGRDSLDPFVERAQAHHKGLFVLVRTSNAGAEDFQSQALDSGRPLFVVVAEAMEESGRKLAGPETGWSSLGVVVGATWPGQAEEVREKLPHALFLVPGYGAQGGGAEDALRGFVPGPQGLEGGLVNSSRGILFPPGSEEAALPVWEKRVDQAIDRAIDELGSAVRS